MFRPTVNYMMGINFSIGGLKRKQKLVERVLRLGVVDLWS
jgi:hypothetical protein